MVYFRERKKVLESIGCCGDSEKVDAAMLVFIYRLLKIKSQYKEKV